MKKSLEEPGYRVGALPLLAGSNSNVGSSLLQQFTWDEQLSYSSSKKLAQKAVVEGVMRLGHEHGRNRSPPPQSRDRVRLWECVHVDGRIEHLLNMVPIAWTSALLRHSMPKKGGDLQSREWPTVALDSRTVISGCKQPPLTLTGNVHSFERTHATFDKWTRWYNMDAVPLGGFGRVCARLHSAKRHKEEGNVTFQD